MDESNKKSLHICLLKILEKYSDVNHKLKQQDLIDKIEETYGVLFDRRTIGKGIDFLSEMGYDIIKNNGYYLRNRPFSLSESKYLIDAIFSSKSISGAQARKMVDKIQNGLSVYDRKRFTYLYKTEQINRTKNEDIMKNIKIISQAIKDNCPISFKKLKYDRETGKLSYKWNEHVYMVYPYYLINNFGNYYLLCNVDGKDNLANFRVDYIADIELIKDKPYKTIREIKECNGYFDIEEYLNEHIYLWGGKSVSFELELKNSSAIQYVIDWFGNKASITCFDGIIKAKIRCNEKAMFYWLLQYGEHVKIISPQYMIDKVVNACKDIIKKHEEIE